MTNQFLAPSGGVPSTDRREILISTVIASNDSTIEFTGLSEDLYKVVFKDVEFGDSFSSARKIEMRTKVQGGAFENGATDYSYAWNGRSAGVGFLSEDSAGNTEIHLGLSSADTDEPEKRLYAEVFIMNIGNASRNTTITGQGGGTDGDMAIFAGIRNLAQDDDGIQFFANTGNVVAGIILLYKIVEGS